VSETLSVVYPIAPWSTRRQFSKSPSSPPDSPGGGRAGQSLGASVASRMADRIFLMMSSVLMRWDEKAALPSSLGYAGPCRRKTPLSAIPRYDEEIRKRRFFRLRAIIAANRPVCIQFPLRVLPCPC
jgi:hypothetical protein